MNVKKGIEFAVTLPDRPGALAQLFNKLAVMGVNIDAFMLYTSFIMNVPEVPRTAGLCKILVDNVEQARDAFSELENLSWEEEVLLVRAADRPGLLAKLFDTLAEEGVNVRDGYASAALENEVLIVLSVADAEKGFEILAATNDTG